MAGMLAAAAGMFGAERNVMSEGEDRMARLFDGGGPGWNSYPTPGRSSGAAAIKRAARKRQNIRARASKR